MTTAQPTHKVKVFFLILLSFSLKPSALPQEPLRLGFSKAIQKALDYSYPLQSQELQQAISRESLRIQNANRLPQVNASASSIYSSNSASITNGTLNFRDQTRNSASIGMSLLLTDFGRSSSLTKQRELELLAQELVTQQVRRDIAQRAASRYALVILNRKLVQVSKDQVQAQEEHLKRAQLRYDAGRVAKYDVFQAETNYNQTRRSLVTRQQNYRSSLGELNILFGEDLEQEYLLDELPSPSKPEEDWREGFKLAEQYRLELQVSRTLLEAQASALSASKASRFPSLSWSTDYGIGNTAGIQSNENWSTGIRLSVPLYTGGRLEGLIRQNSLRFQKLQADLEQLRNDIRVEIQKAQLRLHTAFTNLDLTQQELKAATETARVARLRYRQGLADGLNLVTAENNLGSAGASRSRAEIDYWLAYIDWLTVTGQLPKWTENLLKEGSDE